MQKTILHICIVLPVLLEICCTSKLSQLLGDYVGFLPSFSFGVF